MKRSVLTLITVLIGAAFIVSCTQQGTTATSTTRAATAKASPSPSPAKKKKTTAKKKAAETEASPSPSESASPAPTPQRDVQSSNSGSALGWQTRQLPAAEIKSALERRGCLRQGLRGMLETTLGCLKWGAVGFVVAFALMKLFEASHIHDDIPKPAFKIRQTKRATFVLSAFAAMLSALVWLLVQKLD